MLFVVMGSAILLQTLVSVAVAVALGPAGLLFYLAARRFASASAMP